MIREKIIQKSFMSISFNPINWVNHIDNSEKYSGILYDYTLDNMRRLSAHMRNHQLKLATSVLAVNFTVLNLAEKATQVIGKSLPSRYAINFEHKPLLEQLSKWTFKTLSVLIGTMTFNHLMNLQLSRLYIAASLASTIALHFLWHKFGHSFMSSYFVNKQQSPIENKQDKIEEMSSKNIEKQVEEDFK